MQYEQIIREFIIGAGLFGLFIYTLIVVYTTLVVKMIGLLGNMLFHKEKVSMSQYIVFFTFAFSIFLLTILQQIGLI